VGRYQIGEELGRGAMGVVYKAQDPAIGRVVAIKSIRLSDLTDGQERQRMRDRLFREAQSAGILSHPNIVTIYDILEEDGMAYIFMEYVDGPTLEKLLGARQSPPRETLLSLLRQTAGALDYAHRKGIVHRDIKPANIMVHDGVTAKIADFGVARIASQQSTLSGSMMGTPNYMSPEQVEGKAVDGRADQFSLAVIVYEIMTGEKPFVADHLPTLLYRIVSEEPAPISRLNPSLGPQVESVVRKALSKNPDERYSECTEFIDALIKACSAKSDWVPMARGAMDTMPTMAGTPLRTVEPPPPPAAAETLDRPAPPRQTLFRSLFWALVGIGIVGLALIAAQRFLMNLPSDTRSDQQAAATTSPQSPAASGPAKPSPVDQSSGPASTTTPASTLPGDSTVATQPVQPPADSTPPARPAKQSAQQPVQPAAAKDTAASSPPEVQTPVQTPVKQPEQRPVQAPPERPRVGTTTVQIVTEPVGARVVVDNDPALSCTAPCMLQLPTGRHTLRAQSAGYRPALRILNTPESSDLFIGLEKSSGTLTVSSSPPGATIRVNGREQPQKTPAVLSLPPGTYRIEVEGNGRSVARDVTIADGAMHSLDLTLR
jgi:serine/threonine-protein kinase